MPPRDSSAEHPRRLLAALGLSPSKRRGQTFLHDGNIARKIVDVAARMGPPFLEIGPGLGALTRLLSGTGAETVAVEVDRGLAAHLRERYAGTSVEILEADFLEVPEEDWTGRFPRGATVVGNIPYSLSSPIVMRLMEMRDLLPRAVLMLQQELGERLCAAPGGKEYGILSVYVSVLADARLEFPVRRTCFAPPPSVDSVVLSLRFRPGFGDDLFRVLRAVVRAAFARRRKTLRNAPVEFLEGGAARWVDLLSRAGIDDSARAETVSPDSYLRLARLLITESERA